MGGLGILFFIVLYFCFSIWIIKRMPKWYWRVLALIALVLIPSADALWGRYVVMPELCKDAGLKVFKHASKADGLMGDGLVSSVRCRDKTTLEFVDGECWSGEWFIQYLGVAYVESKWPGQDYARLSLQDGRFVAEMHVEPKSKYEYRMVVKVDTPYDASLYKGQETGIYDRHSGETVSRVRNYFFRGGWAERFLGSFADAGPGSTFCGPDDHDPASQYETIFLETFR